MLAELLEGRYPRAMTLPDDTPVLIRPMVPDDGPALLQFFRGLPEEDRLYLNDDVTKEAVIQAWCRELNYDRVLPLLADVDGRIVADATLHQQPRGWMSHIGRVRVAVAPEYRRRGLAGVLVRELIEVAVDVGLAKLDAEFMVEQEAAMRLMEKLGFYRVAILPQHVWDLRGETHDFVIMVHDIRPDADYFEPAD